jgi:hypothetical protein
MCPDLNSMLRRRRSRDLRGLGSPIGGLVEVGALKSLLIGIARYAAISLAGLSTGSD